MMSSNPFSQPEEQWVLRFSLPENIVAPVEQEFSDNAAAITSFEDDESKSQWVLEMIYYHKPDLPDVTRKLAVVSALVGEEIACPKIYPLEQKDWQAEIEKNFPPIAVPPFFIYGAHYKGKIPVNTIPLVIGAGAAFGSGEHATTSGCLEIMGSLACGRKFYNMLDMGCGTAILAVAMARLWCRPVLAVDIDKVSVRVARENCLSNKVSDLVRVGYSDGYNSQLASGSGPYDLIVANILARPLMLLAKDMKRNLAPGGKVILSGLLAKQEPMVLAAHRMQGLYLKKRVAKDGWHTLLLST